LFNGGTVEDPVLQRTSRLFKRDNTGSNPVGDATENLRDTGNRPVSLFHTIKRGPGHPAFQAGQHPDHIGIGDATMISRGYRFASVASLCFRVPSMCTFSSSGPSAVPARSTLRFRI